MKLSTRSRYGLRAMFDMAYHAGRLPTQVKEISRRQNISPGYLEQIFQDLKKAGLLSTRRGPKGGYALARTPDKITILDVVLATGTDLVLVDCRQNGNGGAACGFHQRCPSESIWNGATQELKKFLAARTLKDLCDEAKTMGLEKELDHRFTYII